MRADFLAVDRRASSPTQGAMHNAMRSLRTSWARRVTMPAARSQSAKPMPIEITDVAHSTWIVIALLVAALLPGRRRECTSDPLPFAVTQQLKGLAILTIVFAHIAYMLVSDNRFLYPLSIAAGVGVDLFLFLSGFGLTLGMLRAPLAPLPFYRRRLLRLFIPFWIVLVLLLLADRVLLGRSYAPGYMLQSLLGWFPRASAWEDVNSPFWYISWCCCSISCFRCCSARGVPG
jgi:hypothetical protein